VPDRGKDIYEVGYISRSGEFCALGAAGDFDQAFERSAGFIFAAADSRKEKATVRSGGPSENAQLGDIRSPECESKSSRR
jgi:hypothetical protein